MSEQLTKPRETFTYIYGFIVIDVIKDTDGQHEEVPQGEARNCSD